MNNKKTANQKIKKDNYILWYDLSYNEDSGILRRILFYRLIENGIIVETAKHMDDLFKAFPHKRGLVAENIRGGSYYIDADLKKYLIKIANITYFKDDDYYTESKDGYNWLLNLSNNAKKVGSSEEFPLISIDNIGYRTGSNHNMHIPIGCGWLDVKKQEIIICVQDNRECSYVGYLEKIDKHVVYAREVGGIYLIQAEKVTEDLIKKLDEGTVQLVNQKLFITTAAQEVFQMVSISEENIVGETADGKMYQFLANNNYKPELIVVKERWVINNRDNLKVAIHALYSNKSYEVANILELEANSFNKQYLYVDKETKAIALVNKPKDNSDSTFLGFEPNKTLAIYYYNGILYEIETIKDNYTSLKELIQQSENKKLRLNNTFSKAKRVANTVEFTTKFSVTAEFLNYYRIDIANIDTVLLNTILEPTLDPEDHLIHRIRDWSAAYKYLVYNIIFKQKEYNNDVYLWLPYFNFNTKIIKDKNTLIFSNLGYEKHTIYFNNILETAKDIKMAGELGVFDLFFSINPHYNLINIIKNINKAHANDSYIEFSTEEFKKLAGDNYSPQ